MKFYILCFPAPGTLGLLFRFFFPLLPPLCRNKRVRRTHMYVRERKKVDFYKRKHMHIYSGSGLWEQWRAREGGTSSSGRRLFFIIILYIMYTRIHKRVENGKFSHFPRPGFGDFMLTFPFPSDGRSLNELYLCFPFLDFCAFVVEGGFQRPTLIRYCCLGFFCSLACCMLLE